MKSFYTPTDVEKIVGVSYRQIQYWDSSGLIKPSYKKYGRYRCYTFEDLVTIEVVNRINKAGVSVQKIRKTFLPGLRQALTQISQPLVNYRVVVLKKGGLLLYAGELIVHGKLDILFELNLDEFVEQAEGKCGDEEVENVVPITEEDFDEGEQE